MAVHPRTYILTSGHSKGRPLRNKTLKAALRRLGFSKEEMVADGFRKTASMLLNTAGLNPDWTPNATRALNLSSVDQSAKVDRSFSPSAFRKSSIDVPRVPSVPRNDKTNAEPFCHTSACMPLFRNPVKVAPFASPVSIFVHALFNFVADGPIRLSILERLSSYAAAAINTYSSKLAIFTPKFQMLSPYPQIP